MNVFADFSKESYQQYMHIFDAYTPYTKHYDNFNVFRNNVLRISTIEHTVQTMTSKTYDISREGLIKFKNSPLCLLEISPLDFWDGLIPFEEIPTIISRMENWDLPDVKLNERLNAVVSIQSILRELTHKLLLACPYASSPKDLRHSPYLSVLPSDCYTLIAGIVFKLDNNGTTYIACPSHYRDFWLMWLQLTGTYLMDMVEIDPH
ncbi:hypothetical protein F7734_10430 [Scytonema sp. UIC 10036]|uniref:hypothetical protein n=1 Tax=Scytonema sp. UIC 10036 TaxID=2304196 RepID=UPI0012DA9AC8|nr:hypothetical protein [Scytonema sp. UIC 10036]MUG92842.1 hypothetical protein [Scytonema sp. UIC 10036]